jgi:hypothetical protein
MMIERVEVELRAARQAMASNALIRRGGIVVA